MSDQIYEYSSDTQDSLNMEINVHKFKKILTKHSKIKNSIPLNNEKELKNETKHTDKDIVMNALKEIKKETINLSEIASTLHCPNADKKKIENLLLDILNDQTL